MTRIRRVFLVGSFLDFAQTYLSTKNDELSGEPRRASTAQTIKTGF